ncbi:MAG: hypothetical protein N2253_07350 [Bacteroidia bacterium]|nr:hypothetical protein [Bacteroidia bacterium]
MAPSAAGKKKKRTLVVIDGDALYEGIHYDFSFLESEKRLEIWFFYKEKINHSFRLRRDFSAQNILLPRYEEDLHLYILKRVCYELGRREGRYKKVFLIGAHHPVWEGLVQFLRERGLFCTHILANDYKMEEEAPEVPRLSTSAQPEEFVSSATPPSKEEKPQKKASLRKSKSAEKATPSEEGSKPSRLLTEEERNKLFKRKGRSTEAHLEMYEKVISSLRALPAGSEMTRAEFRKKLSSIGITIKRDLPGKNLTYFLKRLQESGFVTIKNGRIIIL